MAKKSSKLLGLLSIVIDTYIKKGDPVGSKFLHSLELTDYAPSTLRKYLNQLEQEWLVYQPYNSSGRLPTVEWLSMYIEEALIEKQSESFDVAFDEDYARHGLRYIIETLGKVADGAVVGFLRNDEYFFLGINNLLQNTHMDDMETTKYIVQYIEDKKIVESLDGKMMKKNQVYYTFIQSDEHVISVVYAKIHVNGYDSVIAMIGPMRSDYKKNVQLLKKFLIKYNN
jgi:transcriptional regulator of heat shock response